jgi:nucleotide-binding universal stress UspA family protein
MQQIVFLHTAVISPEREVPRIDDDEIQSLRDRLIGALSEVPDGVEVKVEVQPGRPIDTILRVSQEQDSDLIIVGMAGQNLLQEKLFGSTTMELCHRTTIPIMTLRPQLISTYTTEELDLRCRHLFRYLLLPYDASGSADYLINRIQTTLDANPDRSLECLLLCWVFEEQTRRSLPREYDESSAQQRLNEVKTNLESVNAQVESEIREGNPLSELLEAALERDISAIAISSSSNRLLGWSVPSFAQEILRRSWHPVIYFPPERR